MENDFRRICHSGHDGSKEGNMYKNKEYGEGGGEGVRRIERGGGGRGSVVAEGGGGGGVRSCGRKPFRCQTSFVASNDQPLVVNA